jgi:hypothetical protein
MAGNRLRPESVPPSAGAEQAHPPPGRAEQPAVPSDATPSPSGVAAVARPKDSRSVKRGKVKLVVVQGRPHKSLLFAPGEFLFGRGPECIVRFNSEWVSRQHCLLRATADGAVLRDLNSRNGTLVNGVRLLGERRLEHGDQIQVGPLVFEVDLGTEPVPRASVASSSILPDGSGADLLPAGDSPKQGPTADAHPPLLDERDAADD